MKVQPIDNDTNFKALKINPKLRAEIIKKGENSIISLNNYGKKISDVELYHVVYDDSLHTPKIFHESKNTTKDYFAELKREEQNLGKYYEVPTGMVGETVGGFYPDIPRVFRALFGENAKTKYSEFKKENIFDQAAKYSRLLEELEIKNMVAKEKAKVEQRFKEAEEKEAKTKIEKAVDNLLEKYKYNEPITTSKEKSLWEKIFG